MQMPKTDVDADTHTCRHHLNASTLGFSRAIASTWIATAKGYKQGLSTKLFDGGHPTIISRIFAHDIPMQCLKYVDLCF
jgi:hypothetical protein